MNRYLLIAIFLLSGCATPVRTHQLDLISRNNSGNGTGTTQDHGKQVTIYLNGETYKGTYVYDGVKAIPSFNYGTATATSGYRSATAYGSSNGITYVPGSGKGQLIASNGNNTIRCDFNYSKGSGVGYCEDNKGNTYDLIAH